MPAALTLVKEGAFDADNRNALNSNFTNLSAGTIPFTNVTTAGLTLTRAVLSGSSDAIPPGTPAIYVVTTAGVDAMTLAAPTAAQNGVVIIVTSQTTNAHTITATSLFANGTALKTTATFAAFAGAGVVLMANNLVWNVLSSTAVTFT